MTAASHHPEVQNRDEGSRTDARRQDGLVARDPAGEVKVTVQRRCDDALLLEVEERRTKGERVLVVAAFSATRAFDHWCQRDPLRFDSPIVHQQLRKHAERLWRGEP